MSFLNQRVSFLLSALLLLVVISAGCGGGKTAIGVAVPAPSGGTTVAAGATAVTISAALTNDSTAKGVAWSLSPATGCGTIASSSATAAVYTPPAESALNANCTATITATSVADSTKTSTVALTVAAVAVTVPASEPTSTGAGTPVTLSAGISNDSSGSGLTWTLGGTAPVQARARRSQSAILVLPTTCGTLAPAANGLSAIYTPSTGNDYYCTATITVSASANSNVKQTITLAVQAPLTATVTAANKTYDGTTTATINSCALLTAAQTTPANVTCSGTGTFTSANVGAGITVTPTISLSGSAAANYYLASAPVAPTANISPATPALTLTCAPVTYTATAHVCTGAATGVGGAPVTGSFVMNPVSETAAGSYPTTGTFTSSNANYTNGVPANGTLVINKATATPTVTATNKVYDGTTTEPIGSTACTPNVLAADAANVTCVGTGATFASTSVANGITVTVTGISLSGAPAVNYSLASTTATATANITGILVTPSILAGNKTYDGTVAEPLVNCTTAPVVSNLTCTPATTTFGSANAGNGTVTATGITLGGTAAPNYSLSSTTATASATINPANPTLTLTCPEVTYDATAHACTGTATGVDGKTAVTGSFAMSPVNEIAANSYTTSGTFSSGDTNYASGGQASGVLKIDIKSVTPTVTAGNKVFDGGATEPIGSTVCTPNVLSADTSNVSCVGAAANFSQSNQGTGLTVTVTGISLSGTAAANYSLSTTTATAIANITNLAVTPNITAAGKTYDGTTTEPISVTCTTTPPEANLTCAAASASFGSANAGSETVTAIGITLGGTAAANYSLSSTTAQTTATINPATPVLTLTCTGGTYNTTAYACTGAATGVGGAAVTGSFVMNPVSEIAAGSYPTTGTFTSSNTNYTNGTPANGTLVITKATDTPTVTASSKTYDGTITEPIGSTVCTPHVLAGDMANVTCAGTAASFAQTAVGNNITVTVTGIGLSGTAAVNYAPTATTASTVANITGAPVTASITATSKVYDGGNTEPLGNITCTLTPPVSGLNCTPAAATFSQSVVGASLTVTATGITLSGTNSADYALTSTQATTTANITPATPTLTVICTEVPYDAMPHVCSGTATGVGGAPVSGSWVFSPASGSNAGSYPTTGTFTSSDPDYVSGGQANGTLKIDPATPVVSISCPSPTYSGVPVACTCTATGIGGAPVSGFCTFNPGPETNAGTYSETGTFTSTNPNYLSGGTASGTLNIAQASVTPNITANGKTYDGTPNELLGNITSCTLSPSESNLTCSAAAASFGSPNAGPQTVTATGITLGGTAAPNYVLSSSQAQTSATITQATPTVTVTCGSFLFDGNPHACSAVAMGAGADGNITSSGSFGWSPAQTETAANTYTITATFATSNPNYNNSGLGTGTLIISNFVVTTASLANAAATVPFSPPVLTASGGSTPYTWGPSSPSGNCLWLSLSSTGFLSGTPSNWGSCTVNVQVTDSTTPTHLTANASYTLKVNPTAIVFNGTTLNATVNGLYSKTLTATGGTGSYTWSVANGSNPLPGWLHLNGNVLSGTPSPTDLTSNYSFSLTASDTYTPPDTTSASFLLNVSAAVPASVSVVSGSNQSIAVTFNFVSALVAVVKDSNNNPISGVTVNFAVQPGGNSAGAFLSQNSAMTDSTGQASVTAMANQTAGAYSVNASVGSLNATFNLTNLAGQAFNINAQSGNNQSTIVSTAFASPLTALVTDQYGNLVPNATVNFSAPNGGPSAVLTDPVSGMPVTSELTGSNGQASVIATANSTASNNNNSYSVTAMTPGVGNSAFFNLTNTPNGSTVSGYVQQNNGGGGLPNVPITLEQNGKPVTLVGNPTSTGPSIQPCGGPDNNGCYSFSGVPNGNYTIVPTPPPGATALFSPASIPISITANGSNLMGNGFQASVGYSVSGTVANNSTSSPQETGTIYVNLMPTGDNGNNCNGPCYGTSIPWTTFTQSGGAFTINGVPPGTYTLSAWMDNLGMGVQNGSNPTYVISSFAVPVPNGTGGPNLPVTEPSNPFGNINGPAIKMLVPTSDGVIFQLSIGNNENNAGNVVNSNGIEMPPHYLVEWSVGDPTFTTGVSSSTQLVINANGADQPYVITALNAAGLTGLTSGNSLYFRVRGQNNKVTTMTAWTTYGCAPSTSGACSSPTAVTIGAPTINQPYTVPVDVDWDYQSSTLNLFSSSGFDNVACSEAGCSAAGPLYLGCFDQNSGNFYGESVPLSSLTSVFPGSTTYSITVDTNNPKQQGKGANCFMVAILDNNNNGVVTTPGDATDFGNNGPASQSFTGTGTDSTPFPITLPNTNSMASVTTSHSQQWNVIDGTGSGGYDGYNVSIDLQGGMKLPVSAQLASETNSNLAVPNYLPIPTDIAPYQVSEDGGRFQFSSNTFGTPSVGDSYGLAVSYSDGSSENVNAPLSTLLTSFATPLSPVGSIAGGSLTPTFSWSAPSVPPAGGYTYQFQLRDPNNGQIWQVPGNNNDSKDNSSFTATSLVFGVDPTNNQNVPVIPNTTTPMTALTVCTEYQWTVTVQDNNGNQAQMQMSFTPSPVSGGCTI